jgi:hypothetical protein
METGGLATNRSEAKKEVFFGGRRIQSRLKKKDPIRATYLDPLTFIRTPGNTVSEGVRLGRRFSHQTDGVTVGIIS